MRPMLSFLISSYPLFPILVSCLLLHFVARALSALPPPPPSPIQEVVWQQPLAPTQLILNHRSGQDLPVSLRVTSTARTGIESESGEWRAVQFGLVFELPLFLLIRLDVRYAQ